MAQNVCNCSLTLLDVCHLWILQVRFSEPLRNSVEMNLRATFKVLEFATTVKNLKSFVHVSTAYSNCHMCEVDEKVYPCDVSKTC